MPFDPEFVTFVWFDALVNYISFAPGYEPAAGADLTEFHRWWPALHVIGKDILIPAHGVYWPIMLRALGFTDEQIPTLLVHGWWNIGGEKMSKSLGNNVDPGELADRYGAEALSYFLMRRHRHRKATLILARNAWLSNVTTPTWRTILGNLLNRTLSMTQKYRGGRFRCRQDGNRDLGVNGFVGLAQAVARLWIHKVALATRCLVYGYLALTQFIQAIQHLGSSPRTRSNAAELDAVLYQLAESLRILADPALPRSCQSRRMASSTN